ncbi:hypothetical protein [Pseudomonas sp. BF-B-30]|uniref:hypothetical protein n=1 Tax=Pseudomonas sp. BF-B-30 TaxID=2832388 RepID=UPI001CBE0E93|nr:hypothetical protein [Pseudomonas sp. BF-B-30]
MIHLNIPLSRLEDEASAMSEADDFDKPIIDLNIEQRHRLIDLIEIGRKHASHWWTMLNEMRCRGELPIWVKEQAVRTASDLYRWLNICACINNAFFGQASVSGEASQQMFRCHHELRG